MFTSYKHYFTTFVAKRYAIVQIAIKGLNNNKDNIIVFIVIA